MSDMYDKKTRIPHGQAQKKRPDGSLDVWSVNLEPSRTQQQFKEECDINNIIKKFNDTGQFRHVTSKEGMYGDFSLFTDYRDMWHAVRSAEDAFSTLPAEVRKRFRNDPQELIDFLGDPKNYEEALELGLVNKRDEPAINNNDLNNDDQAGKKRDKKQPSPAPASKSSSTPPAEE